MLNLTFKLYFLFSQSMNHSSLSNTSFMGFLGLYIISGGGTFTPSFLSPHRSYPVTTGNPKGRCKCSHVTLWESSEIM